MSTTWTLIQLPMLTERHALGDSLLMSSTAASSLMTSSSSLIASLDPIMVDFWSAFPCPPPWNEGLLFRVNWTSCVSKAVGERLQWFLADRCNIPRNQTPGLGANDNDSPGSDGGDFGVYGEHEGLQACDLSCKVLVVLFCVIFVVGFIAGGLFILHRRRSKRKDQRTSQQTTVSGGERGRTQYAGIHYASASVISREGERPLPPCPEGEGATLPRQLHSYVYNPHDNDRPSPDHRFHLHLCPSDRRACYRALQHNAHCSDSPPSGQYLAHVYDYISDTDSVRCPRGGNDYTYCMCGGGSSLVAECNSSSTPHQSEGYYSDHDHARQHEVSKPNPRYPAPGGLVIPGPKALTLRGIGALNNNNNSGGVALGPTDNDNDNRGRSLLATDSKSLADVPVDSCTHADVPVDYRIFTGVLAERENPPGGPADKGRCAEDSRRQIDVPVHSGRYAEDSRRQIDVPVHSAPSGMTGSNVTFPRYPPDQATEAVSHRTQGADVGVNRGFHPDIPASSVGRIAPFSHEGVTIGDGLMFENDLRGNGLSFLGSSAYGYEYPAYPDEAAQRANALALHPRYFVDYLDRSTSSV